MLFTQLPNDLGHVAGAMSELPQTPLSHVNLKARQNDTPNAFIKGASTDPRIAPHMGQVVRYEVAPDGFTVEAATPEQVEAWLERVRPPHPQTPPRDLSRTEITDLDELGHGDAATVGAKAANVAELRKMLPAGMVPDGFAIPFSFYDRYMRDNGFYDDAAAIVGDPAVQADPALRDERLDELRRKIRRGELAPELAEQIDALHDSFDPGTTIRCRSSTNNEDLKGFNGAGLYDSHTHRDGRGRPVRDRQAGVGLAVDLPRRRRARVPPHRPPRRRDGGAGAPELRRRAGQRRRGDQEPVRPELPRASSSTSRSARA